MNILAAVGDALGLAFSMTWQVAWALILGFTLSALVQAVVRKQSVTRLLGDDGPKSLTAAAGLGVASSSCSYAAVALARSLFVKGANFTSAIAFQLASTNLVIELGIILVLLMGWEFAAAEYVGGVVMILALALVLRAFLRPTLLEAARKQAERGVAGSMEGHAAMDMSIAEGGTIWRRLRSRQGFTSISHIFVMEWAAVFRDVALGLLIAGAIGAWVPESFWQSFFLVDHPFWAKVWGPLVGPVVAVLSFVCSIGNAPLAAVLWNGGISFGGVVSFLFADLLIVPILLIYRRYYTTRMMVFLGLTLYAISVVGGYVVEILFGVLGLVPDERNAQVEMANPTWNYTTWLNLLFLALAAVFVVRFFRTGGRPMLGMMGGGPAGTTPHHH